MEQQKREERKAGGGIGHGNGVSLQQGEANLRVGGIGTTLPGAPATPTRNNADDLVPTATNTNSAAPITTSSTNLLDPTVVASPTRTTSLNHLQTSRSPFLAAMSSTPLSPGTPTALGAHSPFSATSADFQRLQLSHRASLSTSAIGGASSSTTAPQSIFALLLTPLYHASQLCSLCCERRTIRGLLRSPSVLIALIVVLPLDWIVFIPAVSVSSQSVARVFIIIYHCVRCAKSLVALSKIPFLFDLKNDLYLRNRLKVYVSWCRFMIPVVIAIHCFSLIVARGTNIVQNSIQYQDFILDENETQGSYFSPNMQLYVASVYFLFSIFSNVGYGEIVGFTNSERIFGALLMIIGTLVYTYFIGNISLLLSVRDEIRKEQQEELTSLHEIMDFYTIPQQFQRQVVNYRRFQHKQKILTSLDPVVASLPLDMQENFKMFAKIKVMRDHEMFFSLSMECLQQLGAALLQTDYDPDEYIIRAGDMGSELFFIGYGSVRVESSTGLVVAELNSGIFGEIALLKETPRTASVIANAYTSLFVLKKEDFDKIMKNFPDLRRHVVLDMKMRLQELGKFELMQELEIELNEHDYNNDHMMQEALPVEGDETHVLMAPGGSVDSAEKDDSSVDVAKGVVQREKDEMIDLASTMHQNDHTIDVSSELSEIEMMDNSDTTE